MSINTKQPIGAYATVQWLDDVPSDDILEVYISFGQFDEGKNQDTYGINDDKIFYYAENEHELETLKQSQQDFKVLAYELEYLA